MDHQEYAAFDVLPVNVVIFVSDQIIYANPAALQAFDAFTTEDVVGHSVHEFLYPLDQERVLARIRRAEKQSVINPPTEFRVYTCQRRVLVVVMASRSLAVGNKTGLVATFMDMTERSAMEQRLRESDEQFQRMMNTMQDVFYRTDADGITRYVCPSVVHILGYSAEEIIGLPAAVFYPESEDRSALVNAIKTQGYVRDFPGQMRCKDGRIIDISISSTVLYDEEGHYAGVEGIWRDITTRRELERKLERYASRDELTDILNRRSILEHLECQITRFHRHQQATSVCILDLDHFKKINDQYGHLAGDRVLRQFSEIVSAQLRAHDGFGRLGGEEFLLILPHTGNAQTEELVNQIRQSVSEHAFNLGRIAPIHITVSIGATPIQKGDQQSSSILARADQALYCAKDQGRNQLQWVDQSYPSETI